MYYVPCNAAEAVLYLYTYTVGNTTTMTEYKHTN